MTSRFAVVFRTYQWDAFIERQLARYIAVSDGGDLFVSVDQTHGPVGPVTHDRIFNTTNAGLVALGLANRFEKGSLVWWNNDYPMYAFYQRYPDYDYYVFVEYDSVVQLPLAPMIEEIAARKLDFVAEPMPSPLRDWFWWPYARQVYRKSELHASLNCISVFSSRALKVLFRRRLEMGRDPSVTHWPISEAFIASEVVRAGFVSGALSEFGNASLYNWFPPMLEEDVALADGPVFVHPVLDPPRYVASVLRQGDTWLDYFRQSSKLRQRLSRLPKELYARLLARASLRRFLTMRKEQCVSGLLRARLLFKS